MKRGLAWIWMVASGFAGLGYQIVWTQQGSLWLGHEAPAVLAVVTAFFGGLALGALALGGRIERSDRPARWYAACEALIALWSGVLALALAPLAGWMQDLTGAQPTPLWQSAVAFVGTFVILLPATAAMGATLPAMQRWLASQRLGGAAIAGLYAGNTFGACLGVLASALWLVPAHGLARTAALCALLNLACAIGAWWLDARSASERTDTAAATDAAAHDCERAPSATRAAATPASPAQARSALIALAVTGCLGIGYEVLAVRVISQVAEDTVYTFALLLAVYLVGTALGAAAYARWVSAARGAVDPTADDAREARADALTDRLLAAMALAIGLGVLSLYGAERTLAAARQAVQALLPAGFATGLIAALAAEAALALLAFALPTAVMGALFSHLSGRAQAAGIAFARALGVNTLGAGLAAPLFGVVLVPLLGIEWTLLALALAYLGLTAITPRAARPRASPGPVRSRTSRRSWLAPLAGLALLSGLIGGLAPPLAFVSVPPGGQVLSYREGAMAAVSVVEDAQGVARLRINNRQQEGSSATGLADGRQALLPLLLHPAPRRVLFLGVGTGMTSTTAAQEISLQVDAVDLLPEVIEATALFTQRLPAGPRPALHSADARRYVRATAQRFEVIVADNFHPARSGSGSLYTVEHFQAVRARLADGGLFCQWLPLHQLDLATLRSIVRSFQAVYPNAHALLATNSLETPVLGLLAQGDARGWRSAEVERRIAAPRLGATAGQFGLGDAYAVLGSFVAGPAALAHFAGDAALNTDDRPVVAYRAPRITYQPDSLPRERLMALLDAVAVDAGEVLAPGEDPQPKARITVDRPDRPATGERLAAYWQARNQFLRAGQHIRPMSDARAMLAQVREPLMDVLRVSADFQPAFEPLKRLADAVAADDAELAAGLRAELQQVSTQGLGRRQPRQAVDARP
ncbi:MAG: spermidine synthase [Leptothrix sp. (in: b-proteobacteria)]